MIGQVISHYRVLEQIGAGGMGVVYKAEDTRLGRPLALKFLPVALSRDPMALERFEREARAASSMNHPGICTLYDIGEHEGQRFIAMEFLDGQPLERFIGGKPLPVSTVLELGVQMADAIELAHGQGILHRDIKPANIFITRRGHVKILDFGLAKLAAGSGIAAPLDATAATVAAQLLTTVGMAVGTVAYMSPEQARGEELDHRSDLFSLGLVLHEMATGRQAFSGPTAAVVFDAILNRSPAPIVAVNPDVPLELERIVDKAVEKDRQLRYQSAADLKSDLARLKRDRESGRVSIGGLSESRSGIRSAAAGSGAVDAAAGSGGQAAAAVQSSPAIAPPAPASAAVGAASAAARPVAAAPAPSARRNPAMLVGGLAAAALLLTAAAAYVLWPRAEQQPPVAESAASEPTPAVTGPADDPAATAMAVEAAAAAATETAAPATETAAPATPPPATAPPAAAAVRSPTSAARRTTTAASGPAPAPPAPPAAPVAPAAPEPDPVADAVATAGTQIAQGQFDAAVTALQAALGQRPRSASAPQARLLIARAYDRQKRLDAALAAYGEIPAMYPQDAAAADALLRMADLVQQTRASDRTRTARGYLDQIIASYPTSAVAPRALAQRATIEDREDLKVTDPVLQRVVPAALVTYRQLTDAYPHTPPAEGAFVRLAKLYDDIKRYDLAAKAFVGLGSYFPKNRHDAWWEAGELYEKRVRDVAKAKDAYARVPQTSRRYRDAQKKLNEL
jgi:outer membrane protein assembly factor BamD (BamD/ComL family)/predicted Ser/Thr protein kinase